MLKKTLGEYLFITLTVIIGIVTTLLLVLGNYHNTRLKIADEFQIAANDRINVISRAVTDNIAVSHSVVAFFQASDNVSRSEFSTFAAQLLRQYPYIEALEWAPNVQHSQRGFYENLGREAVPDFAFRDVQPNGNLELSAQRDSYYPIMYIEPVVDYTARVFGVDFMSNPARRHALEGAIAQNRTVVTKKIKLLSSQRPGVLFLSPVVKYAEVRGVVASVVPLGTMIAEAIEPLNKAGVNILVQDVTDEPEILATYSSRLKDANEKRIMEIYQSDSMRMEKDLNVGMRKWRVSIVPSDDFFIVPGSNTYIILLTGFSFTALLAYFMITRIQENLRITQLVELRTKELEQLARYDQLTALPNRHFFLDMLHKALARANRAGNKVAVIYIDLNDFKPVNDRLGHAAGDTLLREFSQRTSKILRDTDTLARHGGDEFAILVDNVQNKSDCEKVLSRLMDTFKEKYIILGKGITLTASMGVAIYPDHARSMDDLIAAADSAMYEAKKDKAHPYVFFA